MSSIRYENPERLSESKDELIGHYNISDVAKAIEKNETEKPKITITFELTRSGMLEITKAEATVDTYKEEQVEVKKNETAANATDTEHPRRRRRRRRTRRRRRRRRMMLRRRRRMTPRRRRRRRRKRRRRRRFTRQSW